MSYNDFLRAKCVEPKASGFDVAAADINPLLFRFQRDIVRWALQLGRAALFEECGLGKTFQQIEWAKHIAAHTGGKVLIVAPLAVAHQTIEEGRKLGVDIIYCRSMAETDSALTQISITNYDMLKEFDGAAFAGVVLDESSILKAFTGATKRRILEMFANVPYKLACTATPAPNDHLELGNHAEFLGLMPSSEMIMRWFINDTMQAGNYRLKKHAAADYWRWVTSWAVCISKPSDLGPEYHEPGFDMPPLELYDHVVEVDHTRAWATGRLLVDGNLSATAMWREKAATLKDRCETAAAIVASVPDKPWIVWCDTNDEADELQRLIPGAIEVRGSQTLKQKEERLSAFTDGQARIIITKPDIAGFGLNWQHCAHQCMVGVTYSFEKFYQALRRSWRFGQRRPVAAHIVYAESEGNIRQTLQAKQEAHQTMQQAMNQAMAEHGLFRDAGRDMTLQAAQSDQAAGDTWTLYLGDCVAVTRQLPPESVDFSVFSPPFSNLYTYSDSIADMGNCKDDQEFFEHFGYLIPELWRITTPGRLCAVHCKDLPLYMNRDGAAGLRDFPGQVVRAFEAHGWVFHSRVTIWKDPVIEMQRTKNHGLLYKNLQVRGEVCRQGMADYLLTFRKWTEEKESPKPVKHDRADFPLEMWQRYASPVWMDIDQTDVLNYQLAREAQDEKHICPLQLGVVSRAVELWTNPGDVVFSPFAGIGSEGYESIKLGRRFVGVELKEAYWKHAQRNLAAAEREKGQTSMFDLMEKAA